MKKEPKPETAKTNKGEQTRALIMETALEMLRERGYEQTTMRALAERAGVSLGNAYHYFSSKEHLIQAFYASTHEEHMRACAPLLADERDLKKRLLAVMRAKINTIEPYHQFAGVLFKTAADPQSHLNPFSDQSAPVREESTRLFAEVLNGSQARVHKDLRDELPRLLWLYHMGITLFWIHDASPRRRRTHRLVEITVDLIVKLIALASNPLMRPLRKAVLEIMQELREAES
jgi:AcrR family transcriptional regulator